MQLNEHLKKVMKILIFAFLCSEMQTTFSHRELTKTHHSIGGAPTATTAGNNRRQKRAPYQASIRLLKQELDYFGKGHICSGALVGPSVVLTVAQCLYNSESKSSYHPAELRVVLGSRQRFAPAHAQIYGVTHVLMPPKQLSIAILMLDRDVPAHQTRIQPISLPVDGLLLEHEDATPLHISSWGLAGEEGHELHEMLTLRVKQSSCQEPQSELCVLFDEQAKLAAYELDEGAPLTKSNHLIGLHSKSTFVDVASHVEWILAQTGNGCNQNSCIWGILGLIVFTIYVLSFSRKSLSWNII